LPGIKIFIDIGTAPGKYILSFYKLIGVKL